jgi:ESCRT-II complex subunit VPS25
MDKTETFAFPREYSFPPFFTRQTNLTTLHVQLTKWSALVLSYCAHYRIFKLSVSEAAGTTASTSTSASTAQTQDQSHADVEELFHNRRLNKRLSLADIREVIDFMRKDGRAEYVSSSNKVGGSGAAAGGPDVVWIYWRTPGEWADLVERWVEETAQKGTVLTLYELTQGEGARGTGEFAEGRKWLGDARVRSLTFCCARVSWP